MKRKITIVLIAAIAVLGLARGSSWAGLAYGSGLTSTLHDFTLLNGTATGDNTTTVGQCTFCHTPHGALSTNLLWNHALSSESYSWDVPQTTAGTNYPTFSDKTWTGPTAKCLSCHDGTVAIGSVNWFSGKAQVLNTSLVTAPYIPQGLNSSGVFTGVHPTAMPYPWNGKPSTYNGVTTGSNFIPSQWASPTTGNVRIWMEQTASTTTGLPSVIMGYNPAASVPAAAAGLQGAAGIECSSCHDPHNKLSVDNYFLVGAMTGYGSGYLCTMCHIK